VAVFNLFKVAKLLRSGNYPDLNAMEPCWWHMKCRTTKKGAASSKKELEKKWLDCWTDPDKERIRCWIERILICIEGGDEYI
jgi:hypothetical protein